MDNSSLFKYKKLRNQIVNVASVPMRSPFRYPGGKTWLIPHVRRWLESIPYSIDTLIETFVGGGIVSLTAIFEDYVDNAVMCEIDEDIASVWQTILSGNGPWLAERIINFDLTDNNVYNLLNESHTDIKDRAFSALVRNRVSYGGILAKGSGIIKKGESGKGIKSRWYPETLMKRILDIDRHKSRIKFIHGDAFDLFEKCMEKENSVFFIDPPYNVTGRRLYTHSVIDNNRLFDSVSKLKVPFLLTYDNSQEIRNLADEYSFSVGEVPMKGTMHSRKIELLISRDLSWLSV